MAANSSVSTYNRVTGFIEVYDKDVKITDNKPHGVDNHPNIKPLATIYYPNKINIKSSFRDLTDTATIVVPRFDAWIIKDDKNLNELKLFDPQSFDEKDLFAKGNIVRIFLGYDFNDTLMFHGYVNEITSTSPVTVGLEDSMWLLKQKTVNKTFKPKEGKKSVFLSDFLGPTAGDDDILKDTGVELDPSVDTAQFDMGSIVTFRTSTVARILKDISDRGLSIWFNLGKLVVGRTYFDSSLTPHQSTKSDPNYVPPKVKFEENVPRGKDNLKIDTANKKTKLIISKAFVGKNRQIQLGVILDPNQKEDIFIPVEISDTVNKNDETKVDATTNWLLNKYKVNVDTSIYSRHSATMPPFSAIKNTVKEGSKEYDEIIESMFDHAKDMFFKFFNNGLSGDIEVFGDYSLKTGQSIDLHNRNNPEIVGEYLITDIETKWGVEIGYRQNLKLGIKINSPK